MNSQLRDIFNKVASTADFLGVDFSDINATNCLGDNALHCVAIWGDVEAATLLIKAGIHINQFGDRGYTPLHNACMCGHMALVQLLISKGADVFAQSEGDLPFTMARLGGHDVICNYLAPIMKSTLSDNRDAYIKSRIAQLKREIEKLEAMLKI